MTLVEMVVAAGILAALLLAALRAMDSSRSMLATSTARVDAGRKTRTLLDRLRAETARAMVEVPRTFSVATIAPNQTGLSAVDLDGFPPTGAAVLEPASASRELVMYDSRTTSRLEGLLRGAGCGSPSAHTVSSEVHWAGAATVLTDRFSPPPTALDGWSVAPSGGPALPFRGTGTGVCFRVPTDPAGAEDYLDGTDVRWGTRIREADLADGYAAFAFEPLSLFDETESNVDVNSDGDLSDKFDVGRIVLWKWSAGAPADNPLSVPIGPSTVLQERCNWGADLNGDGFDDPIFLWDPLTQSLTVNLSTLVPVAGEQPQILRASVVLFLRNARRAD